MMLFSRAPFEYTRLWGPREHEMPHTLSYHRELVWMRPMMIVHLAYINTAFYLDIHIGHHVVSPQTEQDQALLSVPKANSAMESHLTGPILVIGLRRMG